MSADNGTVLRQRSDGKYVIHTYFASDDAWPDVEKGGQAFDTIEAAIQQHRTDERGDYPTEYGLTIALDPMPKLPASTFLPKH